VATRAGGRTRSRISSEASRTMWPRRARPVPGLLARASRSLREKPLYALAAVRRWCDVTGVDFVGAFLERGRERAGVERLPVTSLEGDAENLHFPDASFGVVLSSFGAMFAPDQEKTARELLRVCWPGGKIGMANWTPDGFVGESFRLTARYLPPPAGVQPLVLWGTEARLRELLGHGLC
jgi:SAM-dependent methyltransferase